MTRDYAKTEYRNCWFRHPTLGDPSFDTFERISVIHTSSPPYEWGVNGSLFRDPATGFFYCFAGLYPYGYKVIKDAPSRFAIYKSTDLGRTWTSRGFGFEPGFRFEGHESPSDTCPDAVMTYDPGTKRYWLAYDWCDNSFTWENAHDAGKSGADSGAALAWSTSPEGPFTRLETPFFSNREQAGKLGIFTRGYASTVLKREKDWMAFVLLDSGPHFAWGLAGMTAPSPFGPWSEPVLLLSPDTPGYYPAPVEFYPCFVHAGTVYAPATSVSKNRNYQAVFTCPLESAHLPAAWSLSQDGGVWHSRSLPQEKYGIWGQTFHGFVQNGEFFAVYPSRDENGYGVLSLAKRKWSEPYTDGFTLSGHAGKSVSPLLAAYRDFSLVAQFDFSGTFEIVFDFAGVLGPDRHGSDASPGERSLSPCYALILKDTGEYAFSRRETPAAVREIFKGRAASPITALKLEHAGGSVRVELNGRYAGSAPAETAEPRPVAIIAHEFSVLNCWEFSVSGNRVPAVIKYDCLEGVLNAGRRTDTGPAAGLKWNIDGDALTVFSPKSPELGVMEIRADGRLLGTVDLRSDVPVEPGPVFSAQSLGPGRHGVEAKARAGLIAVDRIEWKSRVADKAAGGNPA